MEAHLHERPAPELILESSNLLGTLDGKTMIGSASFASSTSRIAPYPTMSLTSPSRQPQAPLPKRQCLLWRLPHFPHRLPPPQDSHTRWKSHLRQNTWQSITSRISFLEYR
ncbi:hypothetical protein NL676_023999 [Syzygium grande]|nr:hypothetical protein NL676_023999 [Syzygium grande]